MGKIEFIEKELQSLKERDRYRQIRWIEEGLSPWVRMNGGKVLRLCSKEGSDGGDRIGGGSEEENPIPDESKGGSQNCFGGAEEGRHHQTVEGMSWS